MTKTEVIDYLIYYNKWRRDNDMEYEQPNPTELGKVIDQAVKMLAEYDWIHVEDALPEHLQTVWCVTKDGTPFIGCYGYLENEGWFWAQSNGIIYREGDSIISEAEIDDLDVVYWMPLPKLPEVVT
jgi:hypothetical protein